MDLGLKGKRALVSGSTAGIGLAIASALASEGASVIINGRAQASVDEVVANNEQSMLPVFNSSVVKDATLESAQIQCLAALGTSMERETPLFEDGLIASADGMFWSPYMVGEQTGSYSR